MKFLDLFKKKKNTHSTKPPFDNLTFVSLGNDETPCGIFTLTEGKKAVLPADPRAMFKTKREGSDTVERVELWRLFLYGENGEKISDLEYYRTLLYLKNNADSDKIAQDADGNLVIQPLSLGKLMNLKHAVELMDDASESEYWELKESGNEGEKRREASIKILKKHRVPFMAGLPIIETESETEFRTKEEVCERAICLMLVSLYSEGLEKEKLDGLIKKFGAERNFTEAEKAFLALEKIDDLTRAKFNWRYEALWVLLWALSYVGELDFPTGICDVPLSVRTINERGREKFLAEAKLRSKAEILDQADLIYRIHWATTEARINGAPMPAGLNDDTVYERHYALNWLIGYMGEDWDDVSTDT